ncbi:MAG: hypothetical protein ACJAZ2_001741 [Glaciecola sp.]
MIGDGSQNIFISNNDRKTRVKGGVKANVTNNIIYNWGEFASGASIDYSEEAIQLNLTANLFEKGPSSGEGFFSWIGLGWNWIKNILTRK